MRQNECQATGRTTLCQDKRRRQHGLYRTIPILNCYHSENEARHRSAVDRCARPVHVGKQDCEHAVCRRCRPAGRSDSPVSKSVPFSFSKSCARHPSTKHNACDQNSSEDQAVIAEEELSIGKKFKKIGTQNHSHTPAITRWRLVGSTGLTSVVGESLRTPHSVRKLRTIIGCATVNLKSCPLPPRAVTPCA